MTFIGNILFPLDLYHVICFLCLPKLRWAPICSVGTFAKNNLVKSGTQIRDRKHNSDEHNSDDNYPEFPDETCVPVAALEVGYRQNFADDPI